MITVEKATRNLQRKIRKVSNEALPDLLFLGTRNRSGRSKLDRVIDGLEQGLCYTIRKGYPKVPAAAIVEKRRSQEPDIAAPKIVTDRGAPNPLMRADPERPISVQKTEPLTDEKSAAKARRKANKKGADMDSMIVIAKSVIAGKPSAFTKRDFFIELQKRGDHNRRPGETREHAFARYAMADPDGRVLMQAHKAATGEDYSGEPVKADDVEQAFSRLYADPKNRGLVTTEKRLHNVRVAKAMGAG